MSNQSGLKWVARPEEFFHELVTQTLSKRKVDAKPDTEFYLVNLLKEFISPQSLSEEPLVLLIQQALEKEAVAEQRKMFKQVGDVSLYVAGYFQDSLNRKLVDVDYYIDMGGTAYRQVAARAHELSLRKMYGELAEKFSAFVDVLADISEATHPKTEKDLLRLYEIWLKTKSERAEKALQEAGIVPNATIKKDLQ